MDKKIKMKMRKIAKVIKKFEENVILYIENKEFELDELGNPVKNVIEKEIKMAILTPKTNSTYLESINDSFLSNKKEGYYILNANDNFKISENNKIKYKDKIYKIIGIEENYGIFLRMELNIDDNRN